MVISSDNNEVSGSTPFSQKKRGNVGVDIDAALSRQKKALSPDDLQKTQGLELFSFLVLLLRGVDAEPDEDGLASEEATSELAQALNIGQSLLGSAMASVRNGTSPADAATNLMSSIDRRNFDYSSIDFSRAEAAVAKFADSGNPLIEIIASVESGGNCNIMYNGTATGATYNLTGRTVNQVLQLQQEVLDAGGKGTACGKGQWIRSTLLDVKNDLAAEGIDIGNKLFDEEMQNFLMEKMLERRGYDKFLNGEIDEMTMMRNLSMEWAAIPEDMRGESYYKGVGDNKAHLEPEVMLVALRQARQNHLQSQRQLAFNDGGVEEKASSAPNPSAQFDGSGGVDQVALASTEQPAADDTDPAPKTGPSTGVSVTG